MNFAAPRALFSIIIGNSREVLRQQVMTAFAIALVFTEIYLGCYFWARYRVGMSNPDSAVLALTFGFTNSAAMAVSLLSSTFGPKASVPAALSIVVGSITVVPITLDLLELGNKTVEPQITPWALLRGILRSFTRQGQCRSCVVPWNASSVCLLYLSYCVVKAADHPISNPS